MKRRRNQSATATVYHVLSLRQQQHVSPLYSQSAWPFSVFLDAFSSFLSMAATTPHEVLITGDFNLHLVDTSEHFSLSFSVFFLPST